MLHEYLFKDPSSGIVDTAYDKSHAWGKISNTCYLRGIIQPNPEDIIDITPDWALPEPLIIPVKPKFSFSL